MADLLSELKTALKEYDSSFPWTFPDIIEDIIKKYDWHPTSEKPEEIGAYFTTDDYTTTLRRQISYYNPNRYSSDGWQIYNVIAWMPLPEPYQLKAEE